MVETKLVTNLKRNATRIIAEIQKKKEPILITNRGLPAAYLVDTESYERIQNRMRVLEALAIGEEAARQGHIVTHAQAKKKLAKWLK